MNYYIGICGIAIVGVLLLAATACRCREKGFCRLSGKGEGLSHLPLSHKVFMMFCIGCCIVYASMKSPTNQIPQLSMGVLGSLQQVGNGTDAQEGNGGETSVSDSLRWSNIAVKSSGVSLTACWAPGTVLPGNQLDLYVKHDLDAPTWNYMGSMSFLDSESNLALDISWTDFPDYAADRMFFMLGTHEDTDSY